MTYQHKKLLEISDIAAFSFTCKQCGISLSVPVLSEPKKGKLDKCPACDEPWLATADGNLQVVEDLRKAFKIFSERLSGKGTGFKFALEIPAEPVSVPASISKD
jgi:hypothetical protein